MLRTCIAATQATVAMHRLVFEPLPYARRTTQSIPGEGQSFHPPSRLINSQKTQGTANKASSFFSPTSTHMPSTQLPNTSLPIAITDAIHLAKSHRNLIPLLWDLIEPNIKRKRQLLLPWRYTLSLASVAPAALTQSLQHPCASVALSSSLGVMAILLAKPLITAGTPLQA